jgi:gliding motility-associated-like protein
VISGLPGPSTIECDGTPNFATPTATDNCGTPTLTFADVTTNGTCPNEYTITRTWTADDGCGNTATASQVINVDDTTPPVISGLPGATNIECSDTPAWDVPTATDNCSTPTLTFVDATVAGPCPGSYTLTRTWTADDGCGNTATAVQTINVDDTTPPVISGLPGPSTIECSATPNWVTPTATDNCGTPTLTFADATVAGSCPDAYTITRTWTADDGCGNTATASQVINVDDTTPPVIGGLPGPSTVECSGTPTWVTPTATDNCSTPALTFTDVTVNGSCPNEYTITRTWTATDDCGNTATASQEFSVDDTTPPVISGLPGPSTIECDGTPNWATPTVTDNCSAPTVTFADVTTNGSCPNEFTITRTWTADDGCGNTATASQVINVDDTTPPVISGLPGPSAIECDGTPNFATPTATDNCGTPTLTFADMTVNGSCPNEYTITRTWTADDGCGNTATASQVINVDDTTPPVISGLPGATNIECSDTPAWDVPTATDNCGTPTLTFVDATITGPCPGSYTLTRTWTADDGCGNTATAEQTINVDDTTPPVISGLPGPSTIECDATPNFATPTATDNCGTPTLTFVDATVNGSCPNEYTITRTWTADDGCGNTSTASQVINVDDTTPPVIGGLPGPSTVECSGTPTWVTPTATDNCSTPALTFTDVTVNGTCPNEYSITRTWTATDDCGNTATASQEFSVDDTTPPVISGLPGPSTIECDGTPNWVTPTVTDNCGTPSVTFADVTTNGSCPNEYTITRTWTADDGCGNTATASQVINVDDTTPPVISGLPGPSTIECDGTPNFATPTATDNCGTPSLTFADVTTNGSCPNEYTITRTWTADDGCGNTATASQVINIDDTTPPVISGLPGPTNIECGGTPAWDIPTATDNCGTPNLTFVDATIAGPCPGSFTVTRTWTADDGCGNTSTAEQTINIEDTTPPVISGLPGPSTIECDATPNFATPTATDNCGTPTLTFADVTTNGSCPNEFTITRTWTADDGCGNTATASQVINVDDTTPPVISGLPGPSTVECSGTPNWVTPTATDNCSTPALTFADVTVNGSCPNAYTITRTWTATDDCGNTATAIQEFIVDDTTPPTASSPAAVTVECVGDVPAPDPNVVIDEADNCPGAVTVAFVSDMSSGGPCPEIITRTYIVTDACGNTTLVTQTITVDDTTLPTASSPAPVSVDCIADVPAPDINVITDEADNCPGGIVVAYIGDVSDGNTCPETITRTYSVTDACGNSILVTQTITVDDDVLPTATGPAPLSVTCIGDVPAPDPNLVTDEADNCPGTITVAFVSDNSDGNNCPETITRTYSVTDACGNSILVTQTITVNDDVPPTASNPAPIMLDCVANIPAPDPNVITDEADNCPGAITVAWESDSSDGGVCPETITRTYSITDACGNSVLVTQLITIDDDVPPTASSPASVTVECVGDIPAPDPNVITDEADNCPGALTVAFISDVSGGGPCPEVFTRTYSVTDACGNSILVTQSITVDDTTPPTASIPAPIDVDCVADIPAPDPNIITDEADNCPGALTVDFVGDVSDGGLCPETITRTYSVTDACGNITLINQIITVDDDIAPTASNLAPINVTCISDVPVPDPNLVTDEADNCPGTLTVAFFDDSSDGGSCPETITRSYSVTDACGNQILVTQVITINDDVPPTASNPASVNVECSGSVPVPDPLVVTDEADNCPGAITVAFVSDMSDGGTCPETVIRTYSVTDACGNSILVTQSITVGDIDPPTASNPAPLVVDCIEDVPAPDVNVVTDEADNCGGVLVVAFVNETTDGGLCPETITRNYSVTDECGNSILVTQTITVDDNIPPTATAPAALDVDCFGDVPAPDVNIITDEADNCTAPIVVAHVGDVPDGASCPLTITRTYSITDGCGNQITVDQIISVNDDTPPTATNPSSEILSGCNTPIPAPDISVVTDAADNCGTPVVAFVSDVTDLVGCTETTTRTFSVTDACNNSITVEQLIIRTVDMTPPIFTTPPADVTVNCIAQVPPMVDLDYTDNCSPAGTVVGTETGPSGNPLTIVREWAVTDDCGNTASWMQTITIEETNSQVIINEDLCPGETVTINGEVYDMAGMYSDTIIGENGECDTILTITINQLGYNNAATSADLCPGESVTINGEIYTTGGTYLDTLTGVGGECDTILTITINELTYNFASITADLCPGDTVTINGEEYPVAGMYTDTLTGVGGECDTILSIQINQLNYNQSTVNGSICPGQSITIYGEIYTMEGMYMDTVLSTTGGCDTAVTIIIEEDDLFTNTVNASYCFGSSVIVYGVEYDMEGTYLDTVPSATGGCDTAVTIIVDEQSLILDTLSYVGCEGDGYSVVINGNVYDENNPIGDEIIPGQGTCDTMLHIDLFFAPAIPAMIDPAGPLCLTGGTVTLTAVPPGGTWSGAVTSDQFDPAALGVGTYEVIYTISGSCGSADTIDVVVYELMLSCSTLQNESAPGASDGEAQVSVSGGVPPYDITWTGPPNGSVTLPADGSFTITNLPGGVYNVEVVDATGCIAECEFIITSPVPCELMIDGVTIQDASCPGVNNGSISVDASSNMPPVEYSIDGGAFGSNNVFTMLAPGPHTITVRDAAGCELEQIINVGVGQGPELSLVEVVDATCGQANGSIEVNATGGSTPYNYSIDGITYGLSPLFPGLNAGNYNIYLIDDGGCTDTIPVTVTATNAPIINSIDITQSSCGQADGSLTINASGGLGVLMYSINGGNPQPSPVFSGLMAGTYSILVEDEAGCQVTGSATITDEGGPSIDGVTITPTSCGTFDGTITIMASGTPVLQYQLNNDPFQNSNFFDNLPSGNYTITVRDGNGCLVSQLVNVSTTDGPQITNVVATDTECGLDNGTIVITASGGTGVLEYFVNGDPFDGEELPPGTYQIIVEDENGCTSESFATIEDSEGPVFDVYITPAHCGQADGIVELDAMDGTFPYQYSFDGGPFGPSFTFVNKVSDFYTVAVRDANGCIVEQDIFLWEEDPPSIEDILTTDPDCGQTNGMIVIKADSSGNLMYSIQLPFFQEGPTFTNVAPGNYTITVRDEWGCEDTGTAVINENPNPVLTLDTMSTACGQSIGVITATATGGISPYQYSINNGPFTSNNVFSGLAAGTYTIVVRGNNGCEDTETAVIIAVGTKFGDLTTSICEGDTLFLHGEEFTTAGDYMVDVPGGATNGCDSIVNLKLGIDPLNDVIIDQSICAGDTFTYNGIDYTVAGQYVIDTIASTTGGCDTIVTIDLSVEPLLNTFLDVSICEGGVYTINGMDYSVAGNYVIDTIQAGTGCDSIRTLRLAVEDDSETTITAFICEGDTYTINGMDYTMTGIYNVDTIAGPNSCDTIVILNLTVSPLPTANAGADLTLDCDVQSVTLNGSATGGNILWTGPDINAGNETDLMPEVTLPGIYVLTVTSSQSCIATDTVVVNLDPEAVIADAGPDAFFSCDIDTIVLQASPVGPNYTYQWTGPGINASNENLPNPIVTEPGTYTLVVTDQVSQCVSLPDEVFIDDITVVIIAIIQDPLTLNCFTTSVDLVSTGSSTGPDIVYTWFDQEGNLISTSPGFPVSSGGMFTLIVEDTISGCFDDDSVMVQDLTEYPAVDAGPDQVIDCNHPTVILNEGAVNTNPDLVFEWTGPAGGILGPIDDITAVAGLAGDYILTATDINNGCENDDTVTVTNLTSLPLADINIAQTITCIDSIALLDVGGSTSGQDVTYTWSGPGINNIVADSIETELPGTYFLDVVVESTGCAARDTAILVLPDEPSDLMAMAEIPICEGDTSGSLTINNVSGGTPVYMYALDGGPFQSSPVFDNLMAGQYDIAVVDANGCQYTETFTIADGIPLTIDIGPDIELELGDSVILWADVSLPWSQIDSIVWTPLDILSCEYCTNPTLYGLNDAVVTATVYTGGCIDQDMLNLRVDVDANIYIPNVFSPNGDGINDHVTVFTDHRVRRVVYLEIFDRWGNQVFVGEDFEPNDPLLGWDGRFKGKLMNPAVFAYIARVELINGDLIDRKGDITIVR